MSRLFLVFTLIFSSYWAEAKINFPIPSSTECLFYPALEAELKCDKNIPNYLSGYGLKYCSEFQTRKLGWPKNLRSWVEKTTFCLQKTLTYDEDLLRPCERIQDTAFDSHPRCYKDSGFCEFGVENKTQIIKVVSIADLKSTIGSSSLQALSVALKCSLGVSQGTKLILLYLYDLVRTAVQSRVNEVRQQAIGLIEYIFSDSKNIDRRATQVLAEVIGVRGASVATPVYAEIQNMHSLEQAGEYCVDTAASNNSFCQQLNMKHGKGWVQYSSEKKREIGREGIARAYIKYGLKMK